jgi:solute carrier family 25 (mitochondrial carnitine/acylcarnitine transporter), member 20/29
MSTTTATTLSSPLLINDATSDAANTSHPSTHASSKRELHGALAGSGGTLQEALLGLASGVVFGMVSPIVGHPFDTVKTRMQAEPALQHANIRTAVKTIYTREGLAGFYKGFLPPLLGSMAFRGLLFSAYAGAYAACEHVPILHEPMPYTGGLRPSVLIGATVASFARAAIESPLDFIKVRIMLGKHTMDSSHANTSAPSTASSIKDSAKHFVQSPVSTVRHLYHGFTPTLLRTMGLLGSFFVMVDYSVRWIPEVVNAPVYGPFFKGGVCATAAWIFAFPLETAKSVIQADHTGQYKQRGSTMRVLRELVREKGVIKGWYRGFGPGASRSFFANGASMTVYSWFQNILRE